jgi:competence protein ComEA
MTRINLTRALVQRLGALAGIALLVAAMGGSWAPASAAPPSTPWSATTPPGTKPSDGKPGAGRPGAKSAGATTASADPADDTPHASKSARKELTGKLNLNTATEDQLMLLPTVGPAKAERIVAWRKKNGAFKRPADLRRVKGFGYKTFKRLEPYLDIKGDSTLASR